MAKRKSSPIDIAIQGKDKKFADAVRKTMTRMEKLKHYSKKIATAIKNNWKSVTVGIGAMVAAFAVALKQMGEQSQMLMRVSRNVGVATSSIEKLQSVFKAFGLESEQVVDVLEDFNERIGDARTGGGEAKEAMEILGISMNKVGGETKTTEELLHETAETLRNLEDKQLAATLANKLYGESGMRMVGIITNQKNSLKELMDEHGRYKTITDEQREAAGRMGKEFGVLTDNVIDLIQRGLAPMVPAITKAIESLNELIAEMKSGFEAVGNVVSKVLGMIGDLFSQQWREDVEALAKLQGDVAENQEVLAKHAGRLAKLSPGLQGAYLRTYGGTMQRVSDEIRADLQEMAGIQAKIEARRDALSPSFASGGGGGGVNLGDGDDGGIYKSRYAGLTNEMIELLYGDEAKRDPNTLRTIKVKPPVWEQDPFQAMQLERRNAFMDSYGATPGGASKQYSNRLRAVSNERRGAFQDSFGLHDAKDIGKEAGKEIVATIYRDRQKAARTRGEFYTMFGELSGDRNLLSDADAAWVKAQVKSRSAHLRGRRYGAEDIGRMGSYHSMYLNAVPYGGREYDYLETARMKHHSFDRLNAAPYAGREYGTLTVKRLNVKEFDRLNAAPYGGREYGHLDTARMRNYQSMYLNAGGPYQGRSYSHSDRTNMQMAEIHGVTEGLKYRMEELRPLAAELDNAFSNFTHNLIADFRNAGEAAKQLARDILKIGTQRMIVNPLSKLLFGAADGGDEGGIFGKMATAFVGAFADGGRAGRGLALVGERGPELVDFNKPGMVYSTEQLGAALKSGGAPTINISVNSTDGPGVRAAIAEAAPMIIDAANSSMMESTNRVGATRTIMQGRR